MSQSGIASRYVKPILEIAIEKNQLEQVKSDMNNFQNVCKQNPDFLAMLKSPVISHLKKDQILKQIFKGKVTDITLSLFSIITRKNRELILPFVADEFIKQYNLKMGIVNATVTTAVPLSKNLVADFEKTVNKITGKKPVLKEEVDSEIIGGYILKLDDLQLDESMSGQLKSLKLNFSRESKN